MRVFPKLPHLLWFNIGTCCSIDFFLSKDLTALGPVVSVSLQATFQHHDFWTPQMATAPDVVGNNI